MTSKGELRRLRKEARAAGKQMPSDHGTEPIEFTESATGYRARDKWARTYEKLNGAPESDYDH